MLHLKIENLRMDSTEKKLNCKMELAGETAPIDVEVHYKIEQEGNDKTLVITSLACSREWIHRIVQDFVPEDKRRIPLPKEAHTIVDILKI